MTNYYDILLGENSVGRAEIRQEGLYYRFLCQCCLSGDIMYHLIMTNGTCEYDLGVFVPVGDRFQINTRLPVKRLTNEQCSFRLKPRHKEAIADFIPIRTDEPFSYLEKLQYARMAIRNGIAGIVIEQPDGQPEA